MHNLLLYESRHTVVCCNGASTPGNTVYSKTFEGENFCGCTEALQFVEKYSWLHRNLAIHGENIRG